ncbi:hypothetical protein SUGI_0300890 [Cryptomeria japonica]|nr:hypothetical protein SUGI_0300890 [Cryptomeria japonica]
MPTAAALLSRGGSSATAASADSSSMGYPRGKKFLRTKRKSSGNNTPNNKNNSCPNDENGRSKLNFFKKGILPSPCKNKGNMNSLTETIPSTSKHLGNCGPRESGFDSKGFGLFGGKKNRKSDGKPGIDLVMENVTILKRGENMESVVAGRVSNEEEIGRGKTLIGVENEHGGSGVPLGSKVTVKCVDDGRHGVSVSVDNKVLKQHPPGMWESSEKGQIKKARASVARVSQVCPVGSGGSKSDGGVDCVEEKPLGMMGNDLVTRMGPEPGEVSKEVFGIARSVSIASGSSEFGSDDGDSMLKSGGGSGTGRSSLTSVGSPPSSRKDIVFDSMSDLSPELILSSGQAWAGPTYANSPPPNWLPLPTFFMRHKAGPNNAVERNDLIKGGDTNFAASGFVIQESKIESSMPIGQRNVNVNNQGGVDAFATRNLRRLLHLE